MSKPNKERKKSGTPEKSMIAGKKNLILAVGVILFIAVVAVAAYIVLVPGTGGLLGSRPATTGTGTGAPVVTGDSVSVYYTGMYANGTVFDSNINKALLSFTVGSHQVIPGFENALVGMKAGQTRTVTIPADKAYGPYHPEYVVVINRTGTLATMNLTIGDKLTSRDPSTGAVSEATILAVTPDTLTIDENSPLAGKPLTFTIQLVSVN
jgi:peptidylprolyl isomerase